MGMNPEDMRIGEKADLTLWKRNFNFQDKLLTSFQKVDFGVVSIYMKKGCNYEIYE